MLLTYETIFGEKILLDKIIEITKSMNHNHIGHLMIAIMNRKIRKSEFISLYLKNKMNTKLICECLSNNNELFSVQGMLLLLKYICVYSENINTYEIHEPFIFEEKIMVEVIDAQLMLGDYMQIEIDDKSLLEFNMKKFHIDINLKSLIARTWYIYCKLAVDRTKIVVNDRQYLNFNLDYVKVKGYSIEEFLAVYFFAYNQFNNNQLVSPFINHNTYFKEAKNPEKCHEILLDSYLEMEDFVEVARKTLLNTWDFEMFTRKPFLACNSNYWIIPSDIHLQALLYNNFREVIQTIYGKKGNEFKQYLGYPFEMYVKELCFSACKRTGLGFKEEFLIEGDYKSSEFYMWKDKKMIIIEAKSKDIDRKKLFSQIDTRIIEGIVLEQFVKPIHQIDKAHKKILSSDKYRNLVIDIEEIFAISVTFENTHLSVNSYYDYATNLLEVGEFSIKNSNIKAFFNFGIEEFECIIWLIENGYDIFDILIKYFKNSRSIPLYNFLLNEGIEFQVVPDFLNNIYSEALNAFENILIKRLVNSNKFCS